MSDDVERVRELIEPAILAADASGEAQAVDVSSQDAHGPGPAPDTRRGACCDGAALHGGPCGEASPRNRLTAVDEGRFLEPNPPKAAPPFPLAGSKTALLLLPMDYFTIDEVAQRLRRCSKVARDYVREWHAAQDNPRLPRVVLVRPAPGSRGGRPTYRVEVAPFLRWLRTSDASAPATSLAA